MRKEGEKEKEEKKKLPKKETTSLHCSPPAPNPKSSHPSPMQAMQA